MSGTLPLGGGSSMPAGKQVKKIQKGSGPKQPPTVGPMTHPSPGALLPAGSPRVPPTTGRPRKPAAGK